MGDADTDLNPYSKLFPESPGHCWRDAELRAQFFAEITAMRTSAELGYLHHVELHQQRARDLLQRDSARHTT